MNKIVEMSLASQMSHEDKSCFVLYSIGLQSFCFSCVEIHEASNCTLNPCTTNFFIDELLHFLEKKKTGGGRKKSFYGIV